MRSGRSGLSLAIAATSADRPWMSGASGSDIAESSSFAEMCGAGQSPFAGSAKATWSAVPSRADRALGAHDHLPRPLALRLWGLPREALLKRGLPHAVKVRSEAAARLAARGRPVSGCPARTPLGPPAAFHGPARSPLAASPHGSTDPSPSIRTCSGEEEARAEDWDRSAGFLTAFS